MILTVMITKTAPAQSVVAARAAYGRAVEEELLPLIERMSARALAKLQARLPLHRVPGGRTRLVRFVRGRDAACPVRTGGRTRRVRFVRGRDAACPVRTGEGRGVSGSYGGGTRRVRFVRGEGRGVSGSYGEKGGGCILPCPLPRTPPRCKPPPHPCPAAGPVRGLGRSP